MKILLITTTPSSTSSVHYTAMQLYEALKSSGVSVKMLLPEGIEEKTMDIIHYSYPSFNLLRRFAHVPNSWGKIVGIRKRLAEILKEENFDLIIGYSFEAALAALTHKRKYPAVQMAVLPPGEPSHRPQGTYDRRLQRHYIHCAQKVYQKIDRIFCISTGIQQQCVLAGADPAQTVVIGNGLEEAWIQQAPAIPEIHPQGKLVYYGRLTVEKGVDILIQALAILKKRFPLELLIIGAGSEKQRLQELAHQLGVSDALTWKDQMPREKIPQMLADKLAVVMPSRDEAFGMVLLESMALGIPVISTPTSGGKELIAEDRGWMSRGFSPEELARTIQAFLQDPNKMEKVETAMKFAKENYTWQQVAKRLLQSDMKAD